MTNTNTNWKWQQSKFVPNCPIFYVENEPHDYLMRIEFNLEHDTWEIRVLGDFAREKMAGTIHDSDKAKERATELFSKTVGDLFRMIPDVMPKKEEDVKNNVKQNLTNTFKKWCDIAKHPICFRNVTTDELRVSNDEKGDYWIEIVKRVNSHNTIGRVDFTTGSLVRDETLTISNEEYKELKDYFEDKFENINKKRKEQLFEKGT